MMTDRRCEMPVQSPDRDSGALHFERRRPDERIVHHSDRGAIYTSLASGSRAAELRITRSFGSTRNCYDNAAAEAVWATLKRQLAWIHSRRTWPTRDLLRSAIFDYVEGFYNPQRTQKRLGYCSPAEFEKVAVA
jgi:putative transposase